MKLTDQDRARVAEIEALHAAATPGTWYAVDKGNTVPSHAIMRYATGEKAVNIASGISPKTGNAEFIVNAHGAIPYLLSLIRRLSQEPEVVRAVWTDDMYFDEPVTRCTACGRGFAKGHKAERFPYCPHCGAKMDGERRKERDDG